MIIQLDIEEDKYLEFLKATLSAIDKPVLRLEVCSDKGLVTYTGNIKKMSHNFDSMGFELEKKGNIING